MTDFAQFCQSHGLIVDHVQADNRWHRVKTVSHPHKANGSWKMGDRIGWAIDWATMTEPAMWRPDKDYIAPRVNEAEFRRRLQQQAEERALAVRTARSYYRACRPLIGGHPYLSDHKLDMRGCKGLKQDADGWLVVPVMLDGEVMSIQRISIDGEKRFWPGAPVSGCFYLIERKGASILVLCEGLATGLAIYAAAPLTQIAVCFNSGNLGKVQIRRRGLVCVAADNDLATFERIGINPGLKAAQEAAEALGCGVAAPTGINGTDWCDYRAERFKAKLNEVLRPNGGTESACRRAVDAEIAAAIAKNSKFLTP